MRTWAFAGVAVLVALAGPAAAERTDVLTLGNGDVITGEVDRLYRGVLVYKTDHAGTINVEWEQVASLQSDDNFEIEVATGERFYGRLRPGPEPATLSVESVLGAWLLVMDEVVLITQIGANFWAQIDGSFDFGLTFASANTASTLNLAFRASHRTRNYLRKLDISTTVQDQDDVDRIQRSVANFEVSRFVWTRWDWVGIGRAEGNEELNLDLRTSVTGAMRRTLRQSNEALFSAQTGLVLNQERYAPEAEGRSSETNENLELLGSLNYQRFRFDDPELDFVGSLAVLPSVSDWGRVRSELDLSLRRELVSDFDLVLTLWGSYDSRPPIEDAEQLDYGFTKSLSYSF